MIQVIDLGLVVGRVETAAARFAWPVVVGNVRCRFELRVAAPAAVRAVVRDIHGAALCHDKVIAVAVARREHLDRAAGHEHGHVEAVVAAPGIAHVDAVIAGSGWVGDAVDVVAGRIIERRQIIDVRASGYRIDKYRHAFEHIEVDSEYRRRERVLGNEREIIRR